MMDGFLFLRPYWLLALTPASVILYVAWRNRSAGDTPWSQVIDAHLLRHLNTRPNDRENHWPLMLLGIGWLVGVLALAGPSWQRLPPVNYEPDVPPLVIALDLSRSMNTRDLHPSRLDAGRAKLRLLLENLTQRPVALVVYSSMAHRVLPFTNDRQLVLDTLEYLSPEMMPAQGSHATAALDLASDLFTSYGSTDGDLLLITDGADDDAQQRAKELTNSGIRISVLGMGTADGGYVPDGETGYLLTSTGPVTSNLESDKLMTLAESGGGTYRQAIADNTDIAALLDGFGKPEGTGVATTRDSSEIPQDSGPLFIVLLIPLALLMFRQGGGILVLAFAVVLMPKPAQAFSWDELWLNADQRGKKALDRQQPERATALLRDPLWRGIAAYRSADYATAAEAFAQAPGAIAHYNRGNALARLGRLPEAMDAYRAALQLDPNLEDASQNLAVVQRALDGSEITTERTQFDSGPKESIEPKPKGKSLVADSAEELLDAPRKEDFEQPRGDTERGLGDIGSAGGGAMMVEGADRPETDEGTTIGQGMSEGEEDPDGDDRIARQGGTNNSQAADEATREIAPGHRTPEEDEDTEYATPAPTPESEQPLDLTVQSNKDAEQSDSEKPSSDPPNSQRDFLSNAGAEAGTDSGGIGPSAHNEMLRIWIDGIEDDPSGLLTEKFRREYRRNTDRVSVEEPW